jgi:hypothetical protein
MTRSEIKRLPHVALARKMWADAYRDMRKNHPEKAKLVFRAAQRAKRRMIEQNCAKVQWII